nr:MarR family transcriptional regulator [Maliibacterium massiliense]
MDMDAIGALLGTRRMIFGALFRIATRLEHIGRDYLGELTTKQWFFLAVLTSFFAHPPTLSELAQAMGTSHQNVKQLALRLEQKGFIRITPDARDARALRLEVMRPRADAYARAHEARDAAFIQTLFAGIDADALQTTLRALTRLDENLSAMQAHRGTEEQSHENT